MSIIRIWNENGLNQKVFIIIIIPILFIYFKYKFTINITHMTLKTLDKTPDVKMSALSGCCVNSGSDSSLTSATRDWAVFEYIVLGPKILTNK